MSVIQEIEDNMAKKAKESKEYYMSIWRSHIGELIKLVEYGEGCLSYERYKELKEELIVCAEANWEHNNG